jgi:hypothetical protein
MNYATPNSPNATEEGERVNRKHKMKRSIRGEPRKIEGTFTMDKPRKSLKERAAEFSVFLPFMENREKGNTEDLLDTIVTIREYGFMPGKTNPKTGITNPDYPCFIIDEDTAHFFFGGAVLSDRLASLDKDGYHDEIVADGLPVRFSSRKNADGRPFTGVELFPGVPTAEDTLDTAVGAKKK